MTVGLIGRKLGMTRIFTEEGVSIPVTVIEIAPNRVVQVKTVENDGYSAIQVTTGTKKPSRVNKPITGHYAKLGVMAGEGLWELRLEEGQNFETGKEITIGDVFQTGQIVDVQGTTIGKGFAGTVKRYNFSTQDASHGNSLSHRVPGSTGQNQTPGRVFKGKKMAGHMGNVTRTIQCLEVVKIDTEHQLLLVKGAVPGAKGGCLFVKPSVKARN